MEVETEVSEARAAEILKRRSELAEEADKEAKALVAEEEGDEEEEVEVEEAKAEEYQACSICLSTESTGEIDESSTESITYVARDGSITFHHLWCKFVDQINEEDKLYFNEKYLVEDSGRRSCQNCNP